MKNESSLDRMIRAFLAVIFLLSAYFWLWGVLAIVAYVLGAIMLFTAITGFCGLYKLFGISTFKKGQKTNKILVAVFLVLVGALLVGGSYGSMFFTKKFFLEDYNKMNNFYKQTLFQTGQGNRDLSIENYDGLEVAFAVFSDKYSVYKPYAIKSDKNFNSDLVKIDGIIKGLKETVFNGDLPTAHLEFEAVRPIFQDILKRNNFSLLAVILVDFHDSMEEILTPADEKDSAKVLEIYPSVDAKLKEVEAEANDEEIQLIRKNLDDLKSLAEQNKSEALPAKGAELKSSFVKVYLKRG